MHCPRNNRYLYRTTHSSCFLLSPHLNNFTSRGPTVHQRGSTQNEDEASWMSLSSLFCFSLRTISISATNREPDNNVPRSSLSTCIIIALPRRALLPVVVSHPQCVRSVVIIILTDQLRGGSGGGGGGKNAKTSNLLISSYTIDNSERGYLFSDQDGRFWSAMDYTHPFRV